MTMSKYILNTTVVASSPEIAYRRFKNMNKVVKLLYDSLGESMLEEDIPLYAVREFSDEPAEIDAYCRFSLTSEQYVMSSAHSLALSVEDEMNHPPKFFQEHIAVERETGLHYSVKYLMYYGKFSQWYYLLEDKHDPDKPWTVLPETSLMTYTEWESLGQWLNEHTNSDYIWNAVIQMWQKNNHASSRLRISDVFNMMADARKNVTVPF
jgi:hypothetical protein